MFVGDVLCPLAAFGVRFVPLFTPLLLLTVPELPNAEPVSGGVPSVFVFELDWPLEIGCELAGELFAALLDGVAGVVPLLIGAFPPVRPVEFSVPEFGEPVLLTVPEATPAPAVGAPPPMPALPLTLPAPPIPAALDDPVPAPAEPVAPAPPAAPAAPNTFVDASMHPTAKKNVNAM